MPEDELLEDASTSEDAAVTKALPRYTIASYGADYPVDALVKRLDNKDTFVPIYQRAYVWTHTQASRFVESLLLGLPVPGVFFYKERDTKKLLIVDGQQRLMSLSAFYLGVYKKKEFSLIGVGSAFDGLTYRGLHENDRRVLDDAIIHATIFSQESDDGDTSSIYDVFERLNTGGTPLTPQEIRSCVSRGAFVDLLGELVEDQNWKKIYGEPSARQKDEELILRFFALYFSRDNYERPMKRFLDGFIDKHRHIQGTERGDFSSLFRETLKVAAETLGAPAFRPERNLNVALADALLVGLADRLRRGPVTDSSALRNACTMLMADTAFTKLFKQTTTDEAHVDGRIKAASAAFSGVP